MSSMVIYNSRKQMQYRLFVCMVGVLGSLAILIWSESGFVRVLGGFAFLLCAVYAVASIPPLFRHDPGLIIDDEGVVDQTAYLGIGLMPWNEIEGVALIEYQGYPYLALKLKQPDVFLSRLSMAKRTMASVSRVSGLGAVTLHLGTLEGQPEAILQAITSRGVPILTASGAPASADAPRPAAPPAAPPAALEGVSDLQTIEKLAELRDKGVISEEEFAAKKKQILGL